MAGQALILTILSAILHTLWHSISKKQDASSAFFALAMGFPVVILLPVVFQLYPMLVVIPFNTWILIGLSCAFQAAYFCFLGLGYKHGDLSVVYPIARAYPILMVTGIMFLLGKTPSSWGITGVVLIVAGCFLVPLRHFRDLSIKRFLHIAGLFALLAACGSAGFSICDKANIDMMQRANTNIGAGVHPLLVAVFYNWLVSIFLSIFLLLMALREKRRPYDVMRRQWKGALAVGLIAFTAYCMVLLAMKYVSNVSYVVALRQVSIVLTLVSGTLFFNEEAHRPKVLGTLIIVMGLVIVGLVGR